jgi:hypothetical protein
LNPLCVQASAASCDAAAGARTSTRPTSCTWRVLRWRSPQSCRSVPAAPPPLSALIRCPPAGCHSLLRRRHPLRPRARPATRPEERARAGQSAAKRCAARTALFLRFVPTVFCSVAVAQAQERVRNCNKCAPAAAADDGYCGCPADYHQCLDSVLYRFWKVNPIFFAQCSLPPCDRRHSHAATVTSLAI